MPRITLDALNPQQHEAISHNTGPLLILAGAGSGKTRVIINRYLQLIKKGSPSSILAVTFTNKASAEMKERINLKLKKPLKNPWIGTFHSQCTKILRKEIKVLGYKNDFSIYDEKDQSELIRHILKEFKVYEALYKGMLSRISHLKAACVTPEQFMSNGDGFGFEERLARVYVRYQDELRRCNALDFDDLIMMTVRLFEEHPDILAKYQSKFTHILVDEFQDTNVVQYRLLKHLAGKKANLCVVGDDDQSIYGFRGANIQNILSFEKDFPKAKVVKLEQNYRSTQEILRAAGSIIDESTTRRKKTLWSDRTGGEKVSQCWFANEKEEARYISKLIKEFYLKGMYDYSDFALLYRTNIQSKPLEDAMRRENIPYRVVGSIGFYHRKEIKDMSAYMRLALNKDDNVSLRRIINVPTRGVGASTLSKIEQHAKKNSVSLYAAVKKIVKSGNLTASAREKLDSFIKVIDEISSDKYKDAADMLRNIYIKTGYTSIVEGDKAENVAVFITSFEGRPIAEVMDTISLSYGNDENSKDGVVSLMTMHGAKGLEFPVIFITGLEEGIMPYFKAESAAEIDEERRLFYVAMTRGKDILCLSGARKRMLYAKVQDQDPSRFLKAIPEECCIKVEKLTTTQPLSSRRSRRIKTFKPSFPHAIGSRVRHPKWGVGIVRDCYGEADDQKITVNFPEIGVKRLALKFANLEKIS